MFLLIILTQVYTSLHPYFHLMQRVYVFLPCSQHILLSITRVECEMNMEMGSTASSHGFGQGIFSLVTSEYVHQGVTLAKLITF